MVNYAKKYYICINYHNILNRQKVANKRNKLIINKIHRGGV